jgi:hypothetical protein
MKNSAKESPDYYEWKTYNTRFNEGCPKLLDERTQAKLQWLKDASDIN